MNGLIVSFFASALQFSTLRRISRGLILAITVSTLQLVTSSAQAVDPVQPTPSLDLAVGNTTGSYTNGNVVRTTTYSDSTTVNITESKITVEAFKTTYVNSTWTTPQVTYPMGSTLMGATMWGNGDYNDYFFGNTGYAYPNVKDSWGSLFAYNAIKAANYLDTATGTVVAPTPTNRSSVDALNNRDHGVCVGQVPLYVDSQTICSGMGKITFNFSRPVSNAILNVADLGGWGYDEAIDNDQNSRTRVAVSGRLQLDYANSSGATGMRKLTSNSTLRLDTSTSTIENPIQGNIWPEWAGPFGYGSILVEGTYSQITFDVGMNLFWATRYQSVSVERALVWATDYFGLSWSLQSLVILPQTYYIGTSNVLTTGAAGTGAVKSANATFSQTTSPAHGTVTNFNTSTGTFTYTPNPGFTGADTFLVNLCAPSPSGPFCVQAQETINVTAPVATHETKTALVDVPIVFTKLAGSGTTLASAGSFGNLVLSGSGQPCLVDPSNSNCVTTSVTVSEGTYTLDTATSLVTFTPNSGYVGTATAVTYRVTDNYGDTATATLTPIYSNTPPPAPPAPAPVPVVIFPPTAAPVEITVLNSVTAVMPVKVTPGSAIIDLSKTVIIDPATNSAAQSVAIPDQGTYTVDLAAKAIAFKAIPTFSGTATPVTYKIFDGNGLSASSTATPTIIAPPSASPDAVTIPVNTVAELKISPKAGNLGTIDSTQSCFFDAFMNQCLTNFFVPGQGRWELDRATNKVTFTPEKDYTGGVTQLTYRIFDTFGQKAESTLDVTISKPATSLVTSTPTKQDEAVVPAVTKPSLTWKINRTCEFHQITVRLKSQTMELCDPKTGVAYAMKVCTGKDLTPTYTGWFKPNSFVPGYMNGKGNQKMYYSVFFFKRIAIHGSVNVLDGKCSRGCVRVPMELAKKVYAFAKMPHTQIFVKS